MSAIHESSGFKIGDVVWVGAEGDPTRKVTWKIVSLYEATDQLHYAVLRSGQTERFSTVPVDRLTKWRAVEVATV